MAHDSVPAWIDPMLAKPDGGRMREGPQCAYEYKLDGYRAAMRIAADGATVLTSRNGLDLTAEFAELTDVLTAALRGRAAVLDGEVVVCNEAGHIDFGLLQQRRGRYQKHRTTKRTELFEDVPVRFLAFDLLQLDDQLLLDQPYEIRRRQLTELPMPDPFLVTVVPSFTTEDLAAERLTPQRLLERVAAEGHEGLVAKRLDAPYLPGKRPDFWCKHPLVQTREVIVCGWRPGEVPHDFMAAVDGCGVLGGQQVGAASIQSGQCGWVIRQRLRTDVSGGRHELDRHPGWVQEKGGGMGGVQVEIRHPLQRRFRQILGQVKRNDSGGIRADEVVHAVAAVRVPFHQGVVLQGAQDRARLRCGQAGERGRGGQIDVRAGSDAHLGEVAAVIMAVLAIWAAITGGEVAFPSVDPGQFSRTSLPER